MILYPSKTKTKFTKKSGFGLMEIMVGIGLAAIFGGFSVVILQKQARDRRLAETKVSMQLLHNRAQQAVKRYMAFEMDNFINAVATRRDCFDARGISCAALVFPATPSFSGAVAGNREDEMNRMMNGSYFYSGRPCAGPNCPVRVTTTWNFSCQSTSCTQVTFATTVAVNNNNAANSSERALFASLPPLNSEAIYNKTKRIGLVRTLASSCGVPTAANLVTQFMECDTVTANNSNEVFDSNLGFNYMNGDLRLVASTGTTTGESTGASTGATTSPPLPPEECPTCTRAVMTDNGLECQPSVLCTDPGKIVRGCKCCNPTIPSGGDGWGAWSACTAACAPGGTQTRSCQYPKKDYCDSTCDESETQTRTCNLQPCCKPSGTVIGTGDIPGNLARAEVTCGRGTGGTKANGGSAGHRSECCSGTATYKNGRYSSRCSGDSGGRCRFCGADGGKNFSNFSITCD